MRRLRLNGPLLLGALLGLGLLLVLCLPWLMELPDPHLARFYVWIDDVLRLPPFAPGEQGFVLGSDRMGRDMLSRLIYGARTTLAIAMGVTLLRFVLAVPLGLLAGWRGGWLGRFTSALAGGFGAIPTLILVALILSGLRRMIADPMDWFLIYCAVLVAAGFPRIADQMRLRAQEIALQPHIEAAVAVGAGSGRIIRRHIAPLMRADLLVTVAAEMAWVLVAMGQLAVFGIFVGGTVVLRFEGYPDQVMEWMAEWGQMLGANRMLVRSRPWIPLYPGIALGLAAACFHLLAEGIRIRGLRR